MVKLFKALADFQQEVPIIYKGTSGYGYKYADLSAILKVINPLMKKHHLGFTQLIDGDFLKTIIFHTETGEKIESNTPLIQGVKLKGMNDFQVLGSQITYLRRYALSSALGLVSDADIDAAGEQVGKTLPPLPKDKIPEVIKYLKNGGQISTIRKKYEIDENLEAEIIEKSL